MADGYIGAALFTSGSSVYAAAQALDTTSIGGVVGRIFTREKQHPMLSQGDEETHAFPSFAQAPARLQQSPIVQNREHGIGIREACGNEGFRPVRFDGGCA